MVHRDTLTLGALQVEVVRKDIKHVHLAVYPPDGQVRISAPSHMALETIRLYAITRLSWIRAQQRKMQAQPREAPREYLDRESHYLWGKRYLLKVVEVDAPPLVTLHHSRIELQVRPGSDKARRHEVLEAWYRQMLRAELPKLLSKWQSALGVQPSRVIVQRMKTQWGSCNPGTGIIRLNTDLARKPADCLEYIVVHELAHLLEASHNNRFQALMDQAMPHWQQVRNALNQLPVRHEDWAG